MSYIKALREASDYAYARSHPRARNDPFRFLDLPPELRNHVYSFAVPDSQNTIEFKPRKITSPPHIRYADPKWRDQQRCFLGLSRVCREIRKEFLPLHLADQTILIGAGYLDRYLAFVVSRIDGPRSQAIGNLVVELYPVLAHKISPSMDLLPLLELRTVAPHFKARFIESYTAIYSYESDGQILQIVPITWTATWQEWADIRVTELSFQEQAMDSVEANVDIVVKLKYREQWIKECHNFSLAQDLEEDLEVWMDAVGLSPGATASAGPNVVFAIC